MKFLTLSLTKGWAASKVFTFQMIIIIDHEGANLGEQPVERRDPRASLQPDNPRGLLYLLVWDREVPEPEVRVVLFVDLRGLRQF